MRDYLKKTIFSGKYKRAHLFDKQKSEELPLSLKISGLFSLPTLLSLFSIWFS
jgi:hypothetical protein